MSWKSGPIILMSLLRNLTGLNSWESGVAANGPRVQHHSGIGRDIITHEFVLFQVEFGDAQRRGGMEPEALLRHILHEEHVIILFFDERVIAQNMDLLLSAPRKMRVMEKLSDCHLDGDRGCVAADNDEILQK